MNSSKFGLFSLVLGIMVFLQGFIIFLNPSESGWLISFFFFFMVVAFLPEAVLGPVTQYLGFPVVLPAIGLTSAIASLCKKEERREFAIAAIGLMVLGITFLLIVRFFGTLPDAISL